MVSKNNDEESNVSTGTNSEEVNNEKDTSNKQTTIYFNKFIKGRGSSDEGREEPHYTGLYGYAVIYYGADVRKLSLSSEWTIPTYKK
ncbi:TPA: hypothetical protein ACY4SM_001205 [Clostridium perfringens]|nr:hypothetical protein CPBEC3_24590 [Clostridium perfringens]HCG3172379.1 hypothetical protein [Clostridium perfringens]